MPSTGGPALPLNLAGGGRGRPGLFARPSRVQRARGAGGRGRPGVASERVPLWRRAARLRAAASGTGGERSARAGGRAWRGGARWGGRPGQGCVQVPLRATCLSGWRVARRPSRAVQSVLSCASGRSLLPRLPCGPRAFPAPRCQFPAGLGLNPGEGPGRPLLKKAHVAPSPELVFWSLWGSGRGGGAAGRVFPK